MTIAEAGILIGLAANVIAAVLAILKVGQAIGKFEAIGHQQATEIKELKEETAKLGKVLTDIAVQTTRQDHLEARQIILERHVEDLRRGDGFILPLPGSTGSRT